MSSISITPKQDPTERERLKALKDCKPGTVVRFPNITFEEAVGKHEDPPFYVVIATPPGSSGGANKVALICLDFKSPLQYKDDDREVIVHEVTMVIAPAEKEKV